MLHMRYRGKLYILKFPFLFIRTFFHQCLCRVLHVLMIYYNTSTLPLIWTNGIEIDITDCNALNILNCLYFVLLSFIHAISLNGFFFFFFFLLPFATDVIDWILDNLIEKNRTRRGIIKKLKELGLIFKAPTRKSVAAGVSKHAWHYEQDELLKELYDKHRLDEGNL